MRNEVKISFIDQKFFTDQKNGVTTCKLTFVPQYPPFIKFVLNSLDKSFTKTMSVTAKTRIKHTDKYTETEGYKVALAKAENKAYRYVRNVLRNLQEYIKLSDWQINSFSDKVDRVIEHNIDFMSKF